MAGSGASDLAQHAAQWVSLFGMLGIQLVLKIDGLPKHQVSKKSWQPLGASQTCKAADPVVVPGWRNLLDLSRLNPKVWPFGRLRWGEDATENQDEDGTQWFPKQPENLSCPKVAMAILHNKHEIRWTVSTRRVATLPPNLAMKQHGDGWRQWKGASMGPFSGTFSVLIDRSEFPETCTAPAATDGSEHLLVAHKTQTNRFTEIWLQRRCEFL